MHSKILSGDRILSTIKSRQCSTILWAFAVCLCMPPIVPAFGQAIEIDSLGELQLIGNDPAYPLDGDYILTQDIEASATASWNDGAGFDPIGTHDLIVPERAFTGTFDGQGYVISNLYINRPERNWTGLFGAVGDRGIIQNLGLESGAVTGNSFVAGLAGHLGRGSMSNCYATCAVTGSSYVGGLVGNCDDGTLFGCHATGAVTLTSEELGANAAGGLVGVFVAFNSSAITECYATGVVAAASGSAGGLVGWSQGSVISRCFATGTVSSAGEAANAGGLVGSNGSTVSECYATGNVTVTSEWANVAGGLVGYNAGPVSQCFAMGDVVLLGVDSGYNPVGGLVGLNRAPLSECYSTGRVTGYADAGGLIGFTEDGTDSISFWDTEASRRPVSDGGTGLTTAQMHTLSTFTSAGWDFDTVWYMLSGGSYPYLTNLAQSTVPDVAGLTEANALAAVETSGLCARVAYEHTETTPAGQVIRQSAPEGASINVGVPVLLVVSLGESTSISDIVELQLIGNTPTYPLNGHYLLTQDIDASATAAWNDGMGFDPIGIFINGQPERAFTGTFDGQGHSIANLTINRPYDWCVGLFGGVCEGGIIQNLRISGGVVNGDVDVGALVGRNSGGTVTNCCANVTVTGCDYAGGLVGTNDGGTISRCYAAGDVTFGEVYGGAIGGLVGWSSGAVSECYATGLVTGGDAVGGLVGWSTGSVSLCYAMGVVTGEYGVGGLVAVNEGTVSQCYAVGALSQFAMVVGGLIGADFTGDVEASFWDVDTCGIAGSYSGVGLSTGEMQLASTFTDSGWDFDTTWYMLGGGSYPYLTNLPQTTVPDVVGLQEAEAIAALEEVHLGVNVSYESSVSVPPGAVIRQSVAAGESINSGIRVAIDVSTGPPILISSIEELQLIGNDPAYPLDGDYALTQDIDASVTAGWNDGAGFGPIGSVDLVFQDYSLTFSGSFDGQGHVISNLVINRPEEEVTGLFSVLNVGGNIRNLALEDIDVAGGGNAGGLVGIVQRGTVSNCAVTGVISGWAEVGGLAGANFSGTISGCSSAASVWADGEWCDAGVLVGVNYGTVTECFAAGTANTFGLWEDCIGGLVGWNEDVVRRCYAASTVNGDYCAGGLAGVNAGLITQSYSTGAVLGSAFVGGLVGGNQYGAVSECYSTGTVGDTDFAGGLVGVNIDATVERSFWDIDTSGRSTSDGGTGLATSLMQTQSTFVDAEWDFESVWFMLPGGSYPYLRNVTRCPVPDLAGLSVEEAITALENAGFDAEITYEHSEIIPAGGLVSQSPAAGSEALGRSVVVLVVSLGPESTAITISSIEELQLIGNDPACPLDGDYILVQDIDASDTFTWNSGAGFEPLGTSTSPFTGTFDGHGNAITGLTINRPGEDYVGLFAALGTGGTVSNLGIEGCSITGRQYAGALTGKNEVGSTVSTSYAMGSVAGTDYVAGLAGWNTGALSQCYAVCTVNGTASYAGGLVGYNAYGSVSNCYATGPVTGGQYVGGLAGRNFGGSVAHSYSTGPVTGTTDVGGLVGLNAAGNVESSFWGVDTSGLDQSSGGTGLTTAEMQTLTTFTDADWDFDALWYMLAGGSYPYLDNLPQATVPDVSALSEADAIAALEAAGIVPRATSEHSGSVAEGLIVSQSIPAGAIINVCASVAIVVSLGPEPVLVPDVVGLSQAGAEAGIIGVGLFVGEVSEVFNATVPAGVVISQEPVSGTEVLTGSTVALVVSKGPQPVYVPNVVGMMQANAAAAISGAGLTVGVVTEVYSATIPAGRVISQTPDAGTQALPGSAVALVVSKGPEPVEVPDVVGQTPANAEAAVIAAGLTLGTVTEAYSATIPAGVVCSQNPIPGTPVPPGSAVALVVSRGPQPVGVPNVAGMTRGDAEAAIAAAGLTVGVVSEQFSDAVPAGVVMAQTPPAGSQALPGTVVSFVVSKGSSIGDLGVNVTHIQLTRREPSQTFSILKLNQGNLNWTVDSDNAAVAVSPGSGNGSATITVEWVDFSGPVAATVTVANVDNPGDVEVIEVVSTHPSDITGEGSINAMDIQLVIIQAMGTELGYNCDINGDGNVNAIDVQLVINAALGLW